MVLARAAAERLGFDRRPAEQILHRVLGGALRECASHPEAQGKKSCEKDGETAESCNREFNRCISSCEYSSHLSLDPNAMP